MKHKRLLLLYYLPAFIVIVAFASNACVSSNPLRTEIKQLQKGVLKDDTSYVYQLPYQKNTAHFLVQGYFGKFTHRERAAIDFKMRKGTKILAARGGVVIRLREDGNKGGLKKEYRQYGNFVIIQHADSSRSGYWHLQKDGVLVNIGDTVKQGQVIGLSGNTGYTALPHLHFIVWKYNAKGQWQQIATRFETKKGIRYLKEWKKYRNPK